jgi:hypothetical protein
MVSFMSDTQFKKSSTVVRMCLVVLWKLLLVQHINFIELELEV